MPGRSLIAACVAVLLLVSAWGCDQKVDEGDDKLTEGNQSVDVVYYDSTETVLFDNLETVYMFNDAPVVNLNDVVLGSGLVISTDGLWVNFLGTDGYSPLGNSGCVTEYVPTSADVLDQGYLERGTRRLLWEESLEMPECVSVKDVETIYEVPLILHKEGLDEKITQILNTHEHGDHTGGNGAVMAATGAKLIAHKNAKDKIDDIEQRVRDLKKAMVD